MFAKIPLLLLFLVGTSFAQQTESERMKSILDPPSKSASGLQEKSFYTGANQGISTKSGSIKTFHWSNLFKLKSFTGSKKFDSQEYWTGNFAAGDSKIKNLESSAIPKANEKFQVKDSPVKTDRDANKSQATREYAGDRPYLVPGKSQKVLDSQREAKPALSVDDVRKILNTTQ